MAKHGDHHKMPIWRVWLDFLLTKGSWCSQGWRKSPSHASTLVKKELHRIAQLNAMKLKCRSALDISQLQNQNVIRIPFWRKYCSAQRKAVAKIRPYRKNQRGVARSQSCSGADGIRVVRPRGEDVRQDMLKWHPYSSCSRQSIALIHSAGMILLNSK
jgi:hypothetical protein